MIAPGKHLRMALLLALVAASGSCRGSKTPARPNLVLITIDTLRLDRIGCYGGPEGTTPTLDRLAREGVRVIEAYSAAPITAPSHATLLTGRLPLSHGVLTNGLYRLGEREATLAETLGAQGWSTAAFVGAVPLDHRFGFAQGFSTYDDDFSKSSLRGKDLSPWYRIPLLERERTASEVMEPALAWLEKSASTGPFFLWVHLFDPHSPYDAPQPWHDRFYHGGDPHASANTSLSGLWREPREWHQWMRGITDISYVRALYDGELGFADNQIGRLLDALDRLGRAGDTVVAVTADHGESFGEHNEWFFHGDLVHEPAVRVPLLFRAPWLFAPGSLAHVRARGIDVFPTLLEIMGVSLPGPVDGESLVGSLLSGGAEARPVLLQAAYRDHSGRGVFGYIEGRKKIVAADPPGGGAARYDCFDLATDPRELNSRCADVEGSFEAMRSRFETLRRQLESPEVNSPTVDPEVLHALESLGYVSH